MTGTLAHPTEDTDGSLDYRRSPDEPPPDDLDLGPTGSTRPVETGELPAAASPPDTGPPARDYSIPILPGEGDTDYARYMRTGVLLSLQRGPEERVHRDELLFQTVHQTTELWLKHACFEVEEAALQVRCGCTEAAVRLLARASLGVELVTGQLEMLRHLTPWGFQVVRTALGHGSGFESPGWRSVQQVSEQLGKAFAELVCRRRVDLVELYRGSPDDPAYRLAEAMIEWDERISLWRVRHFKVATRIIGHDVVGTKGTPVDVLTRLIGQKAFPELWRVRTELTQTGPLSQPSPPAQPVEPGASGKPGRPGRAGQPDDMLPHQVDDRPHRQGSPDSTSRAAGHSNHGPQQDPLDHPDQLGRTVGPREQGRSRQLDDKPNHLSQPSDLSQPNGLGKPL